jgi:cyclophilin family peptidyl-prolyl cis-trans isomerase
VKRSLVAAAALCLLAACSSPAPTATPPPSKPAASEPFSAQPKPTGAPQPAQPKPGGTAAPQSGNPTPAAQTAGGKPVAKTWSQPPEMAIDPSKNYTATIKTNMGDVKVQLFPKESPTAVNNFVFLAKQGFYDGIKFHRVIKGFMVQTGDPTGTGAGGPGYRFADEPITSDYTSGTLAMANAGPNTNGSQFFIVHADLRSRLPKNYTIFGRLTGGIDVLDRIATTPVKASRGGEMSQPVEPPQIESITIEEQ